MKHFIITILLISSMNAMAESPYDEFSTKNNFTDSSTIKWKQVPNVQKACDKQRTAAGFPPYGYSVEACSQWKTNIIGQDVCYIITAKKVSMWTLGHEVRHCFQGAYHK